MVVDKGNVPPLRPFGGAKSAHAPARKISSGYLASSTAFSRANRSLDKVGKKTKARKRMR